MPGDIDMRVVNEAAGAAARVIDLAYPSDAYKPLLIMLPVSRDMVRQAKGGNAAIDKALRESLKTIVDTIKWPEDF